MLSICFIRDMQQPLEIMLPKQQFLSVSRQEAKPARQHPPVEYVYNQSHLMLQFLPQKLATIPPHPLVRRSYGSPRLRLPN